MSVAPAVSRLMTMVAISVTIGILLAGTVAPFLAVGALAVRFLEQYSDALPTELPMEPLPQRSRLLDQHGNEVALFFDQNRIVVPLADIAPVMRKAVLAIEDHRFYEHGPLDLQGTLRAFVQNQAQDEVVQGGSTITQQLVKLTLVNQADSKAEEEAATAPTYDRKVRELRYAIGLERDYPKDWILERYLNLAYFGDGAHGVETAAQHFFSRSASELDLPQAALLAGLIRNPTQYDPTEVPEDARERRDLVLDRMAELGMISSATADRLSSRGLGLRLTPAENGCVASAAPFFCEYAYEYLLRDDALGGTAAQRERTLNTAGLSIATTLDMGMQRAADESVARHVHPTDQAIGGLAMVEPGTGAVRALAQSRPMGKDRSRGETYLNYLVPPAYGDARGFQAGSTFKVFVLSAAINQGIPLTTRIHAPSRISLPVNEFTGCDGRLRSTEIWRPRNSTGSGTFNLITGTRQSVNTFYAQLEQRTGLCEPYQLAERMGIELGDPDRQQIPSFTLGVAETNPLSMAEAFATFAARGVHCASTPVIEVRDPAGGVVQTYPPRCERVLRTHVADAVNEVLRGVQEPGGFGHSAGIALDQPSAGKTGTIEDNMAVWFIGYTPDLATAAMIAGANRDGHWITLNGQVVGGERITEAFGSTEAGPMWGDAMKVIQQWLPDGDFVEPPRWVITGSRADAPARD
ncbi:glycosyl transferase [Nocardioides gansuensis]|uniref:Glycosyl transferase n=1 Tax=Nocardioides gansuensis TaxID=2138300 RepID=A0A2T8FGF5_9ACTN|nr:transglycosylase domain-containing protein [Nocardioides gansuensis]PVG84801.1 glycosyl transferase [Nocardioides gansuensis]